MHGLEFDIRLPQEHAAEETDFKQEIIETNSRTRELEGEVQRKCEELKELSSAETLIKEQLALKGAAINHMEEELENLQTRVGHATIESQGYVVANRCECKGRRISKQSPYPELFR